MRPNSPTIAVAAVLVAVIGAAMAFVGLLLLALAARGVETLDPDGLARVAVGVMGVAGLLAGATGLLSACGLWLGRAWGWAGSMAVGVVGSLGAVVALASAGPQVPLLAGTALAGATVALLLAPRTRTGVGLA